MNLEKELENLKKEYIHQEIPGYLKEHGKENLNSRLGENHIFHFKYQPRPRFAFAFFGLVLVATIMIFAQNSKPSTLLYPVKILSDRVVAKLTGDNQTLIEKRTSDLINSTTQSQKAVDQASKEFQKSLDEAKSSAGREDKKQEFQETLENQEESLKRAKQENPQVRGLDEAINHIDRIREETNHNYQKDEKNNSNDNVEGAKDRQSN